MPKTVILMWSGDDGALYEEWEVDDPSGDWRKLEVTLDSAGCVSLTPRELANHQNDIAQMLVEAGKAKFV